MGKWGIPEKSYSKCSSEMEIPRKGFCEPVYCTVSQSDFILLVVSGLVGEPDYVLDEGILFNYQLPISGSNHKGQSSRLNFKSV